MVWCLIFSEERNVYVTNYSKFRDRDKERMITFGHGLVDNSKDERRKAFRWEMLISTILRAIDLPSQA